MGGDTWLSLTGRETGAQKKADAQAQKQTEILQSQQAEADAELKRKQEQVKRGRMGRGSLLSGTELGVQDQLKTTLG